MCDDESFLVLGLIFAALLEAVAAVFIAVSFGGGGVAVLSSLSLLLSGLKMLFVLTNFFWASFFVADLLVSLAGCFCVCFKTGMSFLLGGFGVAFAGLVIGVTVAEALGFVEGFLFDFVLVSSDSEE